MKVMLRMRATKELVVRTVMVMVMVMVMLLGIKNKEGNMRKGWF